MQAQHTHFKALQCYLSVYFWTCVYVCVCLCVALCGALNSWLQKCGGTYRGESPLVSTVLRTQTYTQTHGFGSDPTCVSWPRFSPSGASIGACACMRSCVCILHLTYMHTHKNECIICFITSSKTSFILMEEQQNRTEEQINSSVCLLELFFIHKIDDKSRLQYLNNSILTLELKHLYVWVC